MSKERNKRTIVKSFMVKLHNRRVIGELHADGSIFWLFRRVEHGEIITTPIRMSQEAVRAMLSIAVWLGVLDGRIAVKSGNKIGGEG